MQSALVAAALVLGVLVVLVALLILVHAVWGSRVAPRRRRRLDRTRAALLESLDGEPAAAAAAALAVLPRDLRIQLLGELAASLGGTGRERLTQLAREIGLLTEAEALCRSRRWWRRLQGARLLTMLGGGESVVPPLLRDPNPEVRAQAAEWAADHPLPEVTQALLALLGDQASLCRATVQDSLLRMGARAAEPLARYLEAVSGIGCEAALEVAAGSPDTRFLGPALALASDPSPRVRSRSAAVLGALGGPEAVAALTAQLGDPWPGVRAAAARALGGLGHWPAAPRVASLLNDPQWSVRREAGLALRALGAPGELLLRRAVAGEDRFAADMARLLLALPPAPGGALEPVSGGRA